MCLNWNDERLKLFDGHEDGSEIFQEIAINWVPCNVIHEESGHTSDSIHDECIADLDK